MYVRMYAFCLCFCGADLTKHLEDKSNLFLASAMTFAFGAAGVLRPLWGIPGSA